MTINHFDFDSPHKSSIFSEFQCLQTWFICLRDRYLCISCCTLQWKRTSPKSVHNTSKSKLKYLEVYQKSHWIAKEVTVVSVPLSSQGPSPPLYQKPRKVLPNVELYLWWRTQLGTEIHTEQTQLYLIWTIEVIKNMNAHQRETNLALKMTLMEQNNFGPSS